MVNADHQRDHMSTEQTEWLDACQSVYKRHMYKQSDDDLAGIRIVQNTVEIHEAHLVCVTIGSGPSADAVICMAFFTPSGEVVGFVDCVHDMVFEWPDLSDEPCVHPDLRVILN